VDFSFILFAIIVGFDVDFCRAVSAAIFNGVTNTVVYTDLPASERFQALQDGDVDVLSRLTTVTLSRDVLEPNTGVGFSFSQPKFYDGLTFGGIPPYVSKAECGNFTCFERNYSLFSCFLHYYVDTLNAQIGST
jgi:hypothetical protein